MNATRTGLFAICAATLLQCGCGGGESPARNDASARTSSAESWSGVRVSPPQKSDAAAAADTSRRDAPQATPAPAPPVTSVAPTSPLPAAQMTEPGPVEQVVKRFMDAYRGGNTATMIDLATERSVSSLAQQRRSLLPAAEAARLTDREVLLRPGLTLLSSKQCGPYDVVDITSADTDEATAHILVRSKEGGPEIRFAVIAVRSDGRWRIDLKRTQAVEQAAFILAWSGLQPTRTAVVDD